MILCSILMLVVATIHAQSSKTTPSTTWQGRIAVSETTLTNGRYTLPAQAITLYEANADLALAVWKAELEGKVQGFSGSQPTKAFGAKLPGFDEPVLDLLAMVADNRDGTTQVVVAFSTSDSTVTENLATQETYMRQQAVTLNKRVVQAQIDAGQADLTRLDAEIAKEKEALMKAESKADASAKHVERIRAQKDELAALEKERTDVMGTIEALKIKQASIR